MKKLQHYSKSLGSDVTGEEDKDAGLAIFRGIPYATISKRWTQSNLQRSLVSPFDATQFGPRCPQPTDSVLVSGGVNDPTPGDNEFTCLNLNITVPIEALPSQSVKQPTTLLPVMFWVHGGAFKTGANSVARYRPQVLSSIAKAAGNPFVLVQINYRLGVFGFVASEDLNSEQAPMQLSQSSESTKYCANFGLVDQRNALEWVKDNIQDFGGDPNNVTAFGISAGSASIHYHILSGKPLFDRAILMSGSAPTMGPRSLEYFQARWDGLCKNSNVLKDTSQNRLNHLRSLSPDELIQNYGPSPIGPVADGKLLPKSWRFEDHQPASRCKAIIIGDTREEAIILDSLSRNIPQVRFHQLVRSAFGTSFDAEQFCLYFGFTSEDLPDEAYRNAMRFFLSVVIFQFPNMRIAESYPGGNAYLYHFEEPSPYPGPTFGLSYHGLCALFMYNNERASHPESAQRISLEVANIWTAFAYGKEPWKTYPAAKQFMRFGPNGESGMRSFANDDMREYEYVDWLRDHFDEAKNLVHSLR